MAPAWAAVSDSAPFAPSPPAATRRLCLSVDPKRSKNWFMRTCSRSCSPTSASPVITRTIPGFFSANASSISTSFAAWRSPSASSVVIRFARVNTELSMNSISPSYICALDAKWRYRAASETSSFSASAAVVIRSHFGCSSICASAFRISSRRSPLARGMRKFYALVGVPEHQPRQLRDGSHPQIDIGKARRARAHPDGGHAELLGGAQVLRHVIDKGTAVRVEIVRAQQHPEPVQRRLGPVTGAFDRVHRVEKSSEAEDREHLLDVVARRVGKDELSAAEQRKGVVQRAVADHHGAELGKAVRLAQEPGRVGAVVAHQPLERRSVALPEPSAHLVGAFLVHAERRLEPVVDLRVHRRKDVRPRVVQRFVEVEDPHPPGRREPGNAHHFERISVPTPSSVSTSSSSACGTRPSMMWQERTPARAASATHADF